MWGTTSNSTYDLAGRLATTSSLGGAVSYTYDEAGRTRTIKVDGATVATIGYTPDTAALDPGVVASVTYANGTTLSTTTVDALGRPATQTFTASGSTITTHTVDNRALSGRIYGETIDGTTSAYTYDGAGRLVRADVVGTRYEYRFDTDPCDTDVFASTGAGRNGNRLRTCVNGTTTATSSYDAADRLTATTESGYGSPAYDERGNTTNLAGQTFAYDVANRHLTTAKTGVGTITYVRDAADAIVGRTDAQGTLRYSSGGAMSYVLDDTGTPLQAVLALPGGVLWTRTRSGSTWVSDMWAYPNLHGDIAATRTAADTVNNHQYTPFGGDRTTPADLLTGDADYAWVGQHQKLTEREPGLLPVVQMGARLYDPTLGRFLETDPIEGGSANDYDYTSGDPVNGFDLDGLCKKHKGIFGRARDVACHAGNVATKNRVSKGVAHGVVAGGKLAGRCVMSFDACATNVKIAVSPLIAAGATISVGYGLGLACATGVGCFVAAPLLGPAIAAGAYGTYRLAREAWWGPNRRRIYQRLGE